MRRAWVSPAKYVQGPGELEHLGYYVSAMGERAFLIGLDEDIERVSEVLHRSAKKYKISYSTGDFTGGATLAEVARLREVAVAENCDCVIGIGGGRAIDVAKAVAEGESLIIVPTIASSDAPTSNLAVLYNEDGTFLEYRYFPQNPGVVLVDTDVIVKAPARFLAAGIGDALATFYELDAAKNGKGVTQASFITGRGELPSAGSTLAAVAIAKGANETLMRYGEEAYAACQKQENCEAFEHVVEANLLMSGLGFENGGLAAAHAVQDGLMQLPETHPYLHGEKVAFCLLVQFALDGRQLPEVAPIIEFMSRIQLPVTLKEIGLGQASDEQLMIAAKASCAEREPMHNMYYEVTPEMVLTALRKADEWGQQIQTVK